MKQIGLALSGGGARGFAHLGVLKVIDELNIKISAISGTSAGALFGSMYAAGYKPDDILKIGKSVKLFNFPNILFGKSGFFNTQGFEETILRYIPDNSFEKLKIPFTAVATDIVNNKTVYLNSGELAKSVAASACIPLVFEPIHLNNTYLLDGGILNQLPIEPLLENDNHIIGIHVNSMSNKIEDLHMKDMLDRSFHCALGQSVYSKTHACDVFIEPPDMSRFGMFDFNKADDIFEYAYQYASSIRAELEGVKFI